MELQAVDGPSSKSTLIIVKLEMQVDNTVIATQIF